MDIQNELHETQAKLLERLANISIDHILIAKRAKMTLCEMLRCLELSDRHRMELGFVMNQMAAFKETSAHLLYKEDFALAV